MQLSIDKYWVKSYDNNREEPKKKRLLSLLVHFSLSMVELQIKKIWSCILELIKERALVS